MVVRQPLQPLRIEPIALRPVRARSTATPTHTIARLLAVYLPVNLPRWNVPFGERHWLRRETELPRWSIALCLVVTLVASTSLPLYLWSQRSQVASMTTVSSVAAPFVITTAPVTIPETANTSDSTVSAQVSGLSSATQDLLKQIQQAQHDNATLRAELQAQAQSVNQAQSAAASTDAERSDQIKQLQDQMGAELQGASDQITKLTQSVSQIDQQANDLRKTVGMDPTTYPAITVPNLLTAADPQQAIDTTLTSIGTHIAAVTTEPKRSSSKPLKKFEALILHVVVGVGVHARSAAGAANGRAGRDQSSPYRRRTLVSSS
jgi:hypothetical protein